MSEMHGISLFDLLSTFVFGAASAITDHEDVVDGVTLTGGAFFLRISLCLTKAHLLAPSGFTRRLIWLFDNRRYVSYDDNVWYRVVELWVCF